ncbi:hypothetical protein KFZ56_01385 [Virgibacillus sp. NKC19-3]|uniref:hypothetical protein n=1 Tax=Virgibacillus saliphilus TaxID=2831674 RepID=UPI001C9B8BFB|nr:hypothetical protein [Virgibacillus sp. NKC19-3]MBY7141766.1 hypothetical protein [Virgibacillus sp. NKC19-3]
MKCPFYSGFDSYFNGYYFRRYLFTTNREPNQFCDTLSIDTNLFISNTETEERTDFVI